MLLELRYCFDEAYFFYHKNLLMGFAIDDFKRDLLRHEWLQAVRG